MSLRDPRPRNGKRPKEHGLEGLVWQMLAGGHCSASCQSLGRARRDMFQDSCGGKPFPCLYHAYPDEVCHSLC